MPGLDLDVIRQKIESLALPILERAGIDLVELNVSLYKRDVVICCIADRPTGGITIAQCSALNRAFVEAIDADGFLGEEGYSLEVSSPGLDRPLVTPKDFIRNLNRAVRFWLAEAVDGKKEQSGILLAVNDGMLMVLTKKNKEITLPLAQVIKGMLII